MTYYVRIVPETKFMQVLATVRWITKADRDRYEGHDVTNISIAEPNWLPEGHTSVLIKRMESWLKRLERQERIAEPTRTEFDAMVKRYQERYGLYFDAHWARYFRA